MASPKDNANRPGATRKILWDYELANAPGKSTIGLALEYPPNGFTPPHRHGGATVVATVLEGELLSGMNGNPPEVYGPGQTFREQPGCHHTVSENNSKTKPVKFMAIFIVDTEVIKTQGYEGLTVLDQGWE